MSIIPVISEPVLSAFQNIAPAHRSTLLDVRKLIFDIASNDPRVGSIEETLRWGEPAYITTRRKTGSTIRLGVERTSGMPALFFNCNTTLVEGFRNQFGSALKYSKNRAVLIDRTDAEIKSAMSICIASALTYHLSG
jgi:hypothetical protein